MKKEITGMSMLFVTLSILFSVCLIASNLFATKQFAFFGYSLPAAVIVFPISYIINDCVSEVWGFHRAKQLVWMGFVMNFFFVAMGALADVLPPAVYWEGQEGFHAVFGLAPRVAIASFVAFLAGSFTNAFVMSKMKAQGRRPTFFLACHPQYGARRRARLSDNLSIGFGWHRTLGGNAKDGVAAGVIQDAV